MRSLESHREKQLQIILKITDFGLKSHGNCIQSFSQQQIQNTHTYVHTDKMKGISKLRCISVYMKYFINKTNFALKKRIISRSEITDYFYLNMVPHIYQSLMFVTFTFTEFDYLFKREKQLYCLHSSLYNDY